MNEEWFGVCAKGAPNAKGLYPLFPRTAYYVLKQVHQFNAYADSATLSGLNLYFDRLSETTDQFAKKEITAKDILGNPEYRAICYSGFRAKSRSVQPTLEQVMEDLRLLSAMNIKVIRTYDVHYEISTVLDAIRALKSQDADFEMYVMLGAWINCKDAFSALPPDHTQESEQNAIEIAEAVRLANAYPDIIKIIAVGNEAMVKWAASYYVQPDIILKWVNHLQNLKRENKLPANLWITCSDNFASWGGGGDEYHVEALTQLMKAVDYISMHTYPMLDTHYNPDFWGLLESEAQLTEREKIHAAVLRARDFAVGQYYSVLKYMKSVGVEKQVHIGETGWSTISNELFGPDGSKAADEYKSALYYKLMREWTDSQGLSLFYFEAFDEQWKDSANPMGSENHFGLINLQSQAKYAIWDLVDQGVFKGLTRDGMPITKTYNGDEEALWRDVQTPDRLIRAKN
jgi:exo-beta-1,3-glucanase (GH17 family)